MEQCRLFCVQLKCDPGVGIRGGGQGRVRSSSFNFFSRLVGSVSNHLGWGPVGIDVTLKSQPCSIIVQPTFEDIIVKSRIKCVLSLNDCHLIVLRQK